jgi:hypothetical protein
MLDFQRFSPRFFEKIVAFSANFWLFSVIFRPVFRALKGRRPLGNARNHWIFLPRGVPEIWVRFVKNTFFYNFGGSRLSGGIDHRDPKCGRL